MSPKPKAGKKNRPVADAKEVGWGTRRRNVPLPDDNSIAERAARAHTSFAKGWTFIVRARTGNVERSGGGQAAATAPAVALRDACRSSLR